MLVACSTCVCPCGCPAAHSVKAPLLRPSTLVALTELEFVAAAVARGTTLTSLDDCLDGKGNGVVWEEVVRFRNRGIPVALHALRLSSSIPRPTGFTSLGL